MFLPILFVAGEPIVFFMFAAAVLFQLCTTYNHINTKRVAIFFNHVSYVHLMSSSDSFCKCLQKKFATFYAFYHTDLKRVLLHHVKILSNS